MTASSLNTLEHTFKVYLADIKQTLRNMIEFGLHSTLIVAIALRLWACGFKFNNVSITW